MRASTTLATSSAIIAFSAASALPGLVRRDGLVVNCDPSFHQDCEAQFENYFNEVCYPLNSTKNGFDFNAPCPATQAITTQCILGAVGLDQLPTPNSSYGFSDVSKPLGNDTQRNCICSSQYFTLLEGCESCFMKHGMQQLGSEGQIIPASVISSASKTYCAASTTPTLGFSDFIYQVAFPDAFSSTSAISSSSSTAALISQVTDPIGNKTAISLYFTQTVTGSSVWYIANPTASPATSNGQIVPSAAASSTGASTTKSHNAGVKPTAVAAGGAIVALAAGLVAAL